jgi:hypothetical protein
VTADEARAYLKSLSSHPGRAGDTDYLNPEFAIKLANSIQQARAEGIPASLFSGFRTPGQTGSTYDEEGNSSHSYGLASDIGGIGGAGSATALRWQQIAQANGLSNPYGINNAAEFNHWQLPPQPLERTPQLLSALKTAAATGDMNQVWAAYSPQSVGGGQKSWTADQVFNAIYQQESGGGTNPAAGNNVMQIQPGTWKIYAQPGEDPNNRADNIAVGHRIVNDLMQKFNNDPSRVAVAYFSGEGNVAKDGASPFINDKSDGSTKVSKYVSDIMGRLGAPAGGGGSTAPVVAQQTPATPPNPWATLGSSLGEALGQMSNTQSASSQVIDPPDAPAIRTPAMEADFTPPASSPVPQTLAGGIAPTLASIALQPQPLPTAVEDPGSITAGAPSMTAMLGGVGTMNDPTLIDPRRTGSINPYTRPLTRLG